MDYRKIVGNLRKRAASLSEKNAAFSNEAYENMLREAKALLDKADALAEKYGITESQISDDEAEIGGLAYNSPIGIQGEWFSLLCQAVGLLLPVRFIVKPLGTSCVILGERDDAQNAQDLLNALIDKAKLFYGQLIGIVWHEYLLGFAFGCLDYAIEKNEAKAEQSKRLQLTGKTDALMPISKAIMVRSNKLARIGQVLADMKAKPASVNNTKAESKSLSAGYHDGLHHKPNRV